MFQSESFWFKSFDGSPISQRNFNSIWFSYLFHFLITALLWINLCLLLVILMQMESNTDSYGITRYRLKELQYYGSYRLILQTF
jgi:hypothetical protein